MKFDPDNCVFRHERKFISSDLTKNEIETIVLGNSHLFNEIFYERQINNIYFDDLDKTSYFDNVYGNGNRTKIRIRWYGDFEKVVDPILELKIKRGIVGTKLSFPLKNFSFPTSLDEMQKIFEESNLPGWLIEKLKTQRFALLNHYVRKYFLSSCKRFRITIDSDLTYGEVFNQNDLCLLKKVKENYCVLELKYDIDKDAKDVSTQFPFRLTKSSKFVSGVTHFIEE